MSAHNAEFVPPDEPKGAEIMGPVAVARNWTADGRRGTRLYLWCPGCNDLHAAEVDLANQPSWTWDQNIEAPTLNPSLLVTGVQWAEDRAFHKPTHASVAPGEQIRCHSFVKQGRWEFLGDCTHHLAGQTVPLPPVPDIWGSDSE